MKRQGYSVAVAGATGAVGEKMLSVLEKMNFPVSSLKLLASERSSGRKLIFKGREYMVEELGEGSFKGTDIALFSAGATLSEKFAPSAVSSGAVVIDNSSFFRNDPAVPLVIPEINPKDAFLHKGIISNPNCTTAIMLTALYPLYREYGISRIMVSSYQSVSGAGRKGIEELMSQIKDMSDNKKCTVSKFPHRIAYNVIPHIDSFTPNGYTKEEMKMFNETRKILHDTDITVSATCVRVPVVSVHSMSVTALFNKEITAERAKEILSKSQGVKVTDEPASFSYPMPVNSQDSYDCYIGRIRKDLSFDNALSMWICGDQLLKGAALNAVQIAELLIAG